MGEGFVKNVSGSSDACSAVQVPLGSRAMHPTKLWLCGILSFLLAALLFLLWKKEDALTPDKMVTLETNLRGWEVPQRLGTIEFTDPQGVRLRLRADFNRFRLQEWQSTWRAHKPGPFTFILDKATFEDRSGDFATPAGIVFVNEVRFGDLAFITVADTQAWLASDRQYALPGMAMFVAGGLFLLWSARKATLERGSSATTPVGPATGARPAIGDRELSTRALAMIGTGSGLVMGYMSIVQPWLGATRHENSASLWPMGALASPLMVLVFLPRVLFPTWTTAILGSPQQPTRRGHVFNFVVIGLSLAAWWWFREELRRLGYQY